MNQVKNKGHLFEEQVAFSLSESGHSVEGIDLVNHYPLINEKLKTLFSSITKQSFRKISDHENRNSVSSDFLGLNDNISCKYGTHALKHPPLGTLFSKILNLERKDLITGFPSFVDDNTYYKNEGKQILGPNFYNDFKEYCLKKLNEKDLPQERTLELYDFLIGQDRPIIINGKGNKSVDIINTKNIPTPTSFKLSQNEKKQIIIEFNNGMSFKHRIKTAVNSKNKYLLSRLFKEEFTLISYNTNKEVL